MTQDVDGPGQAGDFISELEISPEMIEAGQAVLDRWLEHWDYLEEGLPGNPEIVALISDIFRCMWSIKPASAIKS